MTALSVNGEAVEVADGTTVADLVARHADSPRGIAVARNEEVVARSAWAATVVAAGDRIEILTAAQGG
jgi:sulfur carrier protein